MVEKRDMLLVYLLFLLLSAGYVSAAITWGSTLLNLGTSGFSIASQSMSYNGTIWYVYDSTYGYVLKVYGSGGIYYYGNSSMLYEVTSCPSYSSSTYKANSNLTNSSYPAAINTVYCVYSEGLYGAIKINNITTPPSALVDFYYKIQTDSTTTLTESGTCTDADSDSWGIANLGSCGNTTATDCNDTNSSINPGRVETGSALCSNGVDDDCDGSKDGVDPGCGATCVDSDGDGYGSWSSSNLTSCNLAGTDCDDSNYAINLGRTEATGSGNCADYKDNDCDGQTDYADSGCGGGGCDADCNVCTSSSTCAASHAGCGWSSSMSLCKYCSYYSSQSACVSPCSWDSSVSMCRSASAGTCTDGAQNQGETGIDCGGPCPACGTSCTSDYDADGFTDARCTGGTDCDDYNYNVNPGKTESGAQGNCYDGLDNDCDGARDSADTTCGGSGATTCYKRGDCKFGEYCSSSSVCYTCNSSAKRDDICCRGEDGASADCNANAVCGNGWCDGNETGGSCAQDCATYGTPCDTNCTLCTTEFNCWGAKYKACSWSYTNLRCSESNTQCTPGFCDTYNKKYCDGNGAWNSQAFCSFCYDSTCSGSTCNQTCANCYTQGACTTSLIGCTWDSTYSMCYPLNTVIIGGGSASDSCGSLQMSACLNSSSCQWRGTYCAMPVAGFSCVNDCELCGSKAECDQRSASCSWVNSSSRCAYKGETWGAGRNFIPGDGYCDYANNETPWDSVDCGVSTWTARCGNGMCEPSETVTSCSRDCSFHAGTTHFCGDGICDGPENSTSCSMDCIGGSASLNCDQACDACDTEVKCQRSTQHCYWDYYYTKCFFAPGYSFFGGTAMSGGPMTQKSGGMGGMEQQDIGCGFQRTESACIASANMGMPCGWKTDSYGYSFCDFNFTTMDFNTMFGGHIEQKNDMVCEKLSQTDCAMMGCKWDPMDNMCWPMFGAGQGSSMMSCDQGCFACEFQNDGSRWNTKTTAENACNQSALGYCKFRDDSWAPNGYGMCFMENYMFTGGGGSCDKECWACDMRPDARTACTNSPAGCKWLPDNYGGWCDFNTSSTCNEACNKCWEQSQCTSSTVSGGCTWNNQYWMCFPTGQTPEICFKPGDEDSDGQADCADSNCQTDPFCGGGMFGFANVNSSGMGQPCWMYDGNNKSCIEDVQGCNYDTRYNVCMPAFTNKMFGGFEDNPPIMIGSDGSGDTTDHLDITQLGIRDTTDSFGFGITVSSITNLSQCAFLYPTSKNFTGKYYYYLDTDDQSNNNCNSSENEASLTGFEFKFGLEISHNGTALVEERSAYKCSNGNWTPSDVVVSTRKDKGCRHNAAMIAVNKQKLKSSSVLYNVTKSMRIYVTSASNRTNETRINDSLGPVYYTPGTIDYHPEDCYAVGTVDMDGDGYPAESDPDCTGFKEKGFVPFEDCWSVGDDDSDGKINCDDEDCKYQPICNKYTFDADANDKTAPRVLLTHVDEFPDFVLIKYDTNEPANGSVLFYRINNTCESTHIRVDDPIIGNNLTMDNFRIQHEAPLNNNSATGGLLGNITNGTIYYYKIRVCDPSGNCGTSRCSNFTTPQYNTQFRTDFDYTPPLNTTPASPLGQIDIYLNYNNGSTEWIPFNHSGRGVFWNYSANVTLRFMNSNVSVADSNSNWTIDMNGVDFTKAVDINISNAFVMENISGRVIVGMNPDNWGELNSELRPDTIVMWTPGVSNSIYHCYDDYGYDCTNITNISRRMGSDSARTRWEIPSTVGFSTYTTSNPDPADSIGVGKGWNLVSFNINTSKNIGQLLTGINGSFDAVYAYNNSGKYWMNYMPNKSGSANFTVDPSMSFWIHTNSTNKLTVSGQTITDVTNITLYFGWNRFAYPKSTSNTTSAVLSGLAGNYTVVWEFDRGASNDIDLQGRVYSPSKLSGNTLVNMSENKGYWIYINNSAINTTSPYILQI